MQFAKPILEVAQLPGHFFVMIASRNMTIDAGAKPEKIVREVGGKLPIQVTTQRIANFARDPLNGAAPARFVVSREGGGTCVLGETTIFIQISADTDQIRGGSTETRVFGVEDQFNLGIVLLSAPGTQRHNPCGPSLKPAAGHTA